MARGKMPPVRWGGDPPSTRWSPQSRSAATTRSLPPRHRGAHLAAEDRPVGHRNVSHIWALLPATGWGRFLVEFGGEPFGVEGTFQRVVWFQDYQEKLESWGGKVHPGFSVPGFEGGGSFLFQTGASERSD